MPTQSKIEDLTAQVAHLQTHYDRAVANGWREAADWGYELGIAKARLWMMTR